MNQLLREISRCVAYASSLPHTPRPVVAASAASRILLIGQAPMHATGIPWNDPSGDTLRAWLAWTRPPSTTYRTSR
jgi:uracil-DNA glycosylase